MNKKLIAIAIAGAMAAPMAAHAGEATIYGVMDVSIDAIDNDDNDSSTGVSSNSSRIGFKGAEDLGGGMKAVWQVETGINVGNGSTSWAGRNTFAGLAGGFGTFILGKHDTPLKTTGRKAELFGNAVADSRNIISGAHIDLRPNNVVAYITPNMGGFQVVAAYVTDALNTTNETGDVDAYSASFNYGAGPLFVSFATEEIDTTGAGLAADHQTNRLAATYKMGAVKVAGLWQSVSDEDGIDGNDRDAWGLGAGYTMGNNTIKAQYYTTDEHDNVATDDGSDMWAIGLDHSMSKRTKLYAVYADMDNDDGAARALGGGGHGDQGPMGGPQAGGTASAFSVGMQHKF